MNQFDTKVIDYISRELHTLGLQPTPIPMGQINELKGGLKCYNLKNGDHIDAVILLSKVIRKWGYYPIIKYTIDYAVRGTIKGVLQGRIIAGLTPKYHGLYRKQLSDITWDIPEIKKGSRGKRSFFDAKFPEPGEIWDEGPHRRLVQYLNRDNRLVDKISDYLIGLKISHSLVVISDRWGESLRIRGSLRVKLDELKPFYLNPLYLEIMNSVSEKIKVVRREFGGLSF